jgi:aspartyl-tRNA(Asn)/glutamyl-tRNA(Gln) amidotransferase subunit C
VKISIDEVNHIANLAKLRLSDTEAKKLAGEFEVILEHFNSINKLQLEEDIPLFSVEADSILRADTIHPYEGKDKLYSNAKSMSEDYIKVPKIIE